MTTKKETILSFLSWAFYEKDLELADRDNVTMTLEEEIKLVEEYIKESKKNGN